MATTQRIRDPIHDLIVFDEKDGVDQLAWRLINTPEFQRLRRIRQLGVSEFVFPGATHTRFTHSIGVYHNARRLVRLIDDHLLDSQESGNAEKASRDDRSKVIRVAALLHDIGHGPFSHAFEGARLELARAQDRENIKKHEFYSAELIRHPDTAICKVLSEFDPALPEQVAQVIEADDPADIYHAVVSSSFDADRLDYLQRDRYMTGTRAGSVDLEWLMRNLIIEDIRLAQEEEDDPNPTRAPTFAFSEKARGAAEDFLLARYRLFTDVYLHKTTRGFEKVVAALIEWLGTPGHAEMVGIEGDHPLIRFLTAAGVGRVEDYAYLDDIVVWGLIERLGRSAEAVPRGLARCLLDRNRPKCLDLSGHFQRSSAMIEGTDSKIRKVFSKQLGSTVFRDNGSVNLYKDLSGVSAKEHKLIRVRTADNVKEISAFPDTIISNHLKSDRIFVRYYFSNLDEFERARRIMTEGR